MVCTVLCLYKRVCVCVWTYTDQHYAHSITRTHIHYKYMTPFKILWHELLSMSTEHHCHISKPLPWESLCQIPDHLKHIPIAFPWRLHGWLAVQAHMLKSIFLIPFVTIVFSLTTYWNSLQLLSPSSLSLWSYGTSAPNNPFTFPKASPFQSAVATFYPPNDKI